MWGKNGVTTAMKTACRHWNALSRFSNTGNLGDNEIAFIYALRVAKKAFAVA